MPITNSRHGPTAESAAVRSASPAPAAAGQVTLWTGKWPVGRRIALFLSGLSQQFFHAIFFRMLLVPGYEWLGPIDPLIYLLTEAGALATSFGLLALPFLKTPNRIMRVIATASFALGVLGNAARMIWGVYVGNFWFAFVCEERGFPRCNLAEDLFSDLWIQGLFGLLLVLNLGLFLRMRRGIGAAG